MIKKLIKNVISPSFGRVAILCLLACCFVFSPSFRRGVGGGLALAGDDDARWRRAKSEYAFEEALRMDALDSAEATVALLRHALALDSTNTAAAYYLGLAGMAQQGRDMEHYQEALAMMKRHFDAHPGDYYEAMIYGDACAAIGQPRQALAAAQAIAAVEPNKFEVLARLARAYSINRMPERALAVYDSIEAMHGTSQAVTDRKIECRLQMGDSAGAVAEQRTLLATAPQSVEYTLAMANVMFQLDRRDSALVYLDRAEAIAPGDGNVFATRALFYNAVGDSVNYLKETYRALTSDNLDLDDKQRLLVNAARRLYVPGDTSARAATLFETLIARHPHEPVFHRNYADYLVACERYTQAAEELSYALDMDPTDVELWHRLMIVQLIDHDYEKAIATAARAIEYNDSDPEVHSYVGQAYYQMQRYDEAVAAYDRALALSDSTDVEELSNLTGVRGDALFQAGDTVAAFQAYEQSLALNPDNAGILNNYAYFLALSNRDLDRALQMARRAVDLTPGSATYLDTLAWVYHMLGDRDNALLYIRQAIDAEPDPQGELLDHLHAIESSQ